MRRPLAENAPLVAPHAGPKNREVDGGVKGWPEPSDFGARGGGPRVLVLLLRILEGELMRKKMPAALSNTHSSKMIALFRDSCDQLATYSSEALHGVRFLRGSLPVTYFGRLTHPDLRVLTVGLNPSWREFDEETGIVCRSGPGQVVSSLTDCTVDEARKALALQTKYFSIKRERKLRSRYFDEVEPFLSLIGASSRPIHDQRELRALRT
jgi:hypothetical protein